MVNCCCPPPPPPQQSVAPNSPPPLPILKVQILFLKNRWKPSVSVWWKSSVVFNKVANIWMSWDVSRWRLKPARRDCMFSSLVSCFLFFWASDWRRDVHKYFTTFFYIHGLTVSRKRSYKYLLVPPFALRLSKQWSDLFPTKKQWFFWIMTKPMLTWTL